MLKSKGIVNFCAIHYKILTFFFFLTLAVFPFLFSSPLSIRLSILCMVFIMLSLSLHIITGLMGQTSFGTSAFWGIGCYTAALCSSHFGVGSEVTFLAAMLVSALFSLLLSIPVMKLRGYYLSIVTLGFCEIIRMVELNWMSLTRGPMGLPNIAKLNFLGNRITNPTIIYFIMLALLALTTYFVVQISNSHFGIILTCIRDDELATSAMGINVVRYKIIAFIIYAAIAGLAGAFYAHYVGYIDPSMFSINQSIEISVMVILGGLGNIVGCFLGATILTIVPEMMRNMMEYRMLLYGLLMVVLMIMKPAGMLGKVNFKYIRQRLSFKAEQTEKATSKRGKGERR